MPFFHTFSAHSSHPGTCNPCNSPRSSSISQPASSSAPRVMSPLMPEKQSKYASFMGVRHNRGNLGAPLPSPQEMCPTEHFDSIGGAVECQISPKSCRYFRPTLTRTQAPLYTVLPRYVWELTEAPC